MNEPEDTTDCPLLGGAQHEGTFSRKCPLCLGVKRVPSEVAAIFHMAPNGAAKDVQLVIGSEDEGLTDTDECRIWEAAVMIGDMETWDLVIRRVLSGRGTRGGTHHHRALVAFVTKRYMDKCNRCLGSGVGYIPTDPHEAPPACVACKGYGALRGHF